MKHAALFTLALLLSACTITSHTTVKDTGAGTLAYEIGLDKTDLQTLSGLGETPEQFCDSLNSEGGLPQGSRIEKEQRGDTYYCIVTSPFTSLESLRNSYGTKGVTIHQMELVDGKFVYDLTINGAALISGDGSQFSNFQPTLNWQVTAPGTVGDNNADKVDGNTLTWVINTNGPQNIHVESTASAGGLPGGNLGTIIAAVCGCLLCLLVLGAAGGGFYWWMGRRKKSPTPEPTPVEIGSQLEPFPLPSIEEPDSDNEEEKEIIQESEPSPSPEPEGNVDENEVSNEPEPPTNG